MMTGLARGMQVRRTFQNSFARKKYLRNSHFVEDPIPSERDPRRGAVWEAVEEQGIEGEGAQMAS